MDALDLHVSDGYTCLLRQRDAERAAREKAEAERDKARSTCAILENDSEHLARRVFDLAKENAALKVENERLRAAIATPEVYAGVVSEVVEKERDEAVVRLTAAEAIIKTANRRYAKSIGKEEMLSSAEQEEAMLHHVLEMENTIVWDAVSPEDASKMDVVNEYRERAEKAEKEVKRLARFAKREAAERAKGGDEHG
jgi:regulator of replication initiation timing